MINGKKYDKEGDAYGNGSTLHARTDRGRPEKTPKSPDEREGAEEDTPPPNTGNSNGEWGSAGGI